MEPQTAPGEARERLVSIAANCSELLVEAKRIRGTGLGMIMGIAPRTASWLRIATETIGTVLSPSTKRASLLHALRDPDTLVALAGLEEACTRINDDVKGKRLTLAQRETEAAAMNDRMIASLSTLFPALLATCDDHERTSDINKQSDYEFMRAAIEEARKSKMEQEKTPLYVGAVVVKDGNIIARGHRGQHRLGEHAEYTTLERNLTEPGIAANATLYCTLEPCTVRNHPKRPCVEWIKRHKVSRVVIGVVDPNRAIRGGGIKALRQAGIDVQLFPHALANEIEALNSAFEREHEEIDTRHRNSPMDARAQTLTHKLPSFSSDVMVVGLARHEVRKLGFKIDALISDRWSSDLISAIDDLLPYAESRSADVSFDILSILISVATHTRRGMTSNAARAIHQVATYALPTRSLGRRRASEITEADVRVLSLGCELGEGLAYDAAVHLHNLVVFDAGVAILANVLRHTHLDGHAELRENAEKSFDAVKDAVQRVSFADASRWLEFKQAEALAENGAPQAPHDLVSTIYAKSDD